MNEFRWNFAEISGARKLVSKLSYGVVCVILRSAVLLQCQTDGQTDRQTHDYSIYRASVASRGKNCCPNTHTDIEIQRTSCSIWTTKAVSKRAYDLLKEIVTKQSESGGGVGFVSGVRESNDGVGDLCPGVVRREPEPDGRRVAVGDDGDADSAAVDVQLSNNSEDEVLQLTILGRTDRSRIVHHEHHVHRFPTHICITPRTNF